MMRRRGHRNLASITPQLQKSQVYQLGNVVSESKASCESRMGDRPLGVQGL